MDNVTMSGNPEIAAGATRGHVTAPGVHDLRSAIVLGRRLAPLVVALGFVGIAATSCTDQAAAARVGDQTLSESELLDELRAFVDNEPFLQANGIDPDNAESLRGGSSESFSQEFVGFVLENRIVNMLIADMFDGVGLVLSDGVRDQGRAGLASDEQSAAIFEAFPASYQDQLVDDQARAGALQAALGEDFQTQLVEAAETTDIELSSRYGTFDVQAFLDQEGAITPPAGPLPAPGDTGDRQAPGRRLWPRPGDS
jgi:hypothetical protein